MHLTLYLLNQGLHTAGDAISVSNPSKQQKIAVAARREASMLKPENRWNETKIGQLILDVPFSNDFQGFRIGLVPISIAGRPTGAKRWNSGTNPRLGAQVN